VRFVGLWGENMTSLELIILGIVSEGATHAYNIEKKVEEKGIRERFNIGFSTIYSVLKKLEKEGLVVSEVVRQEALPAKKVYSLSHEGQRVLREEIKKLLSLPTPDLSGIELGLMFSGALDKEEVIESVNIYIGEINRLIKECYRSLTELRDVKGIERLLLNRRLAFLQTEKKWLSEVITFI